MKNLIFKVKQKICGGTSVCEKLVFQSETKNEIRGDRDSMKNYSFEVKRKIQSAGGGICEK